MRKMGARSLYEAVGIARGDREGSRAQTLENFRLFGAPHVAIVTTDRALGVYGAIDCGLYLGCLLMAFESCGLGAIPQASITMMSPFVREYFKLPENRAIICAISFGFPDHDAPANNFRTDRAGLDQVIRYLPE